MEPAAACERRRGGVPGCYRDAALPARPAADLLAPPTGATHRDALVMPKVWTARAACGILSTSDATAPRGAVGRHGRPVREDDAGVGRGGATVGVPFAE